MMTRILLLVALFGLVVSFAVAFQSRSDTPDSAAADADSWRVTYGAPRRLGYLANREVRETSGLAASRRDPALLWTHNDSGDEARIFAFDLQGRDIRTYKIPGAQADDWEDMASFRLDGMACLLLADVGDNWVSRAQKTLYLVEEPAVEEAGDVRLLQTVHFRFDDGPHDCEAVGFDPTQRQVLLIAKQIGFSSSVYVMAWPEKGATGLAVARSIGTIPVPLVTAMDVSPDGRRAVVLTYGHAYEYVRAANQDWAQALSQPGRRIVMPHRQQGESICYGSDGQTLYLTSEKLPTPLLKVPVQAGPSAGGEVPEPP